MAKEKNIKKYFSKVGGRPPQTATIPNEATNLFYSYVGCYGEYMESHELLS